MKYRDPGINRELKNSGLILGWIQRRVVKYTFEEKYCLSIKKWNELCNSKATVKQRRQYKYYFEVDTVLVEPKT
jgi:hypothetical protein